MRADMSGVVRGCPGEHPAAREGSRQAPLRPQGIGTRGIGAHDKGAVAAEFVLLTSLIAGVTVGLAAVIGTWVEQPLTALVSALGGLTGVN